MILQLLMGYISCIGFGFIFNNKIKSTFIGSIAGALGWGTYLVIESLGHDAPFCTFMAALIIGFLCENFAKTYKDATVVFLMPAILPLVPGAGVYFTMRYLIDNEINLALNKGINTIACAAAIAIGILFASSIYRALRKLFKFWSVT